MVVFNLDCWCCRQEGQPQEDGLGKNPCGCTRKQRFFNGVGNCDVCNSQVCNQCAPERYTVPQLSLNKNLRLCHGCLDRKNKAESLTKYVDNYGGSVITFYEFERLVEDAKGCQPFFFKYSELLSWAALVYKEASDNRFKTLMFQIEFEIQQGGNRTEKQSTDHLT